MTSRNSKQTGPLQNLFSDIKRIISFMELKDINEADKYETEESKNEAEMYLNYAKNGDNYLTYKAYWNISMFQEVYSNIKFNDIKDYMNNPLKVPIMYHANLLKRGREEFLKYHEEKNEYYRMLNGLPPIDTAESNFIYLSKSLQEEYCVENIPVHLLSPMVQNRYMDTDEYKEVLNSNPEKKYLKYLGIYKIDILSARLAKDFEIIRYPSSNSDINPNLLREFANTYKDYREYVMVVLYNKKMEDLYVNYRNFMGLIIMMFTMLQISNKAVEAVNSKNFLDDSILHIILSMYDIPKTLLMTNETRRNLVINMLKLIREKGTDDVYYDLVNILGYQDVIISKLLLMKGQRFIGENNEASTDVDPYFIQVPIDEKDLYSTITSGNATIHDYHKITDADPTWWDMDDTKDILKNSNYSMSDSKYIMIEATVNQMNYLFESIYFSKLILDNRVSTDQFYVEIPDLFGTNSVSIFDMMVFIVSAMCMNNGLTGEIISEEHELLSTAGFNFDIDFDSFVEYLDTTKYVDKEKILQFIENFTIRSTGDINRLFNDVMYPMRQWLEYKISNSNNRHEYIEYESIYRALFTYGINRNSILEDFELPMESICEEFGISEEEMNMYKYFYPRSLTGEKVTIDTIQGSRYRLPFYDRTHDVDWYIHIIIDTQYGEEDRGYLYFHDILNSDDVRNITNSNGMRIFMDYEDGDIGWELNSKAVEKALYLIDHLDEDALASAHFQVDTPRQNGKTYLSTDKLPSNIRGIYKKVLRRKIEMDIQGLAVPPKTYLEYLYRKNIRLYNLLTENDRFHRNKDAWMNDIMKVVLALETELNTHMKYFEQSVVGQNLFFKPLITLIKYFKSTFVTIAKAGIKYVFGDKMDAGGNSNMFKLFDDMKFVIHFVTLANRGYESQFGLYDTEHKLVYKVIMKDQSKIYKMINDGWDVQEREKSMGSIHMIDEVKFFKNGKPLDLNFIWCPGEFSTDKRSNIPVDLEGWKEYTESYNP